LVDVDRIPHLVDRMRGALIGLAVGDAVGTTVEFKRPGMFARVTDMVGGGPFGLLPGQWTDDTSMALCLAESLIHCRGFDPRDQMERYVRWSRDGHLSSTGRCFDIGNTVARALSDFEETGEPFSGPTGEMTAGNGSLMRLAPIPLFFFGRPDAITFAAESSRTTHGAPVAVDACRYLAALITGALADVPKDELLASFYSPQADYWDRHPLHPVVAEIARGSFKEKSPPAIRGSGYAAHSLEAALWAFHNSADFREGCLVAVNLGEDADTTAAIYGQLAGTFYGYSAIPVEWRSKLAHRTLIESYADRLLELSLARDH
jgi:ADP-ribosyl-[dinitrogen reductase] hydrolase